MSYPGPPPIQDAPAREGPNGKFEIPLQWVDFFNGLWEGDAGSSWSPSFTSLSTTGDVAVTGNFVKITNNLVFFTIVIDPTGGGSVSATAGTTYAEGFPLNFSFDTACIGVSGGLGGLPGHVVASSGRIYIPAISSATVPVTIVGIGVAR